MIIIFEGADRSGKSTIANALSTQLNIPYFKVHRDKYWWDPAVNLNYLDEGITQFIEQTQISVIIDRWVPSDYMYSKLFSRDISYHKIWEIDQRFAKMNTLLVICYKDKDKHIVDIEDADFVNPSMYDRMLELYKEYTLQSKIKNVLFLNTSDENLQQQLFNINMRL